MDRNPSDVIVHAAIRRFERSVEVARGLSERHPGEWIYDAVQIEGLLQMATIYKRAGRYDEAVSQCDAALAGANQLVADYPNCDWFKYLVGSSARRRGDMLRLNGCHAEALDAYDQALNELSVLLTKTLIWKAQVIHTLGKAYSSKANVLTRLGRPEDAESVSKQSREFHKSGNHRTTPPSGRSNRRLPRDASSDRRRI